ncbi:alpha/beta hydrolase [Anaeromyxobacter sp. Fw109-5]|uniref:alpha/beta hydrolase n=1 Tax=Anaeromyxobacter sp. (strain Fw109-5) TaxID=404589 RepID=UPI0000ED6DAA|nr:alpha/beta hydrolase [Anaeromyxobacter sp. Fw109-5]ABS28574.1 alpha/beta hydrolase fold [Anaeromyxobacter sp. Fw109-5]
MSVTSLALLAAAALLALAVLTGLHYAFWQRVLAAPTGEDEVLHARTGDGWTLALGRRRPRGPARLPPVLLVHGIAMNRQAFDFGVERYSVSAFLARAGFDCFALDLRGHGGSRRGPTRRWNLDTYLREDLPAALDAIRDATGEASVLYVGHSQGALLGMAACALHPERLRAIVALAPPAHFDAQARLRALVKLRHLPVGGFVRLLSRLVAPFSGYWHPAPAELAINLRNVERPVYRRMLSNAIENLHRGVLEQFATFVREDSFRSMDGQHDYRALLASCRQPALFVSAEKDGLAPPAVVEAAFRGWGGPKRYWSCGRDYGHGDVLVGRNSPEVVFPMIRDFLLEHSEGRPVVQRDAAGRGSSGAAGPG